MQGVVISIEFAERVQEGQAVVDAVTRQLLENEFSDKLVERLASWPGEGITVQRINIHGDDQEDWKQYYMMTIYEKPTDFPNHFVVRKWRLVHNEPCPDPVAYCVSTLEQARNIVPPTLHRTARTDRDDKNIVETWI
jgi:hypothetical protein